MSSSRRVIYWLGRSYLWFVLCGGIARPLPQVLLVVPCAILIIIYLQSERPELTSVRSR